MTYEETRVRKGLLGWILFIALVVMLFLLLQKNTVVSPEVSLRTFTRLLENGHVARVSIGHDELVGQFRGPQVVDGHNLERFHVTLPEQMTSNWTFVQWLMNTGNDTDVRVERENNLLVNILLPLIPWLLIFSFIWFFVFRQVRQQRNAAKEPWRVVIVRDKTKA